MVQGVRHPAASDRGLSNREIAAALVLSEAIITTDVARVLRELDLRAASEP